MLRNLQLTLIFIALSWGLGAQVMITEYSASNMNQFADNYNKFEDWVEITNMGNSSADISGYGLSDKFISPGKYKFPAGTILAAQERILVYCSGRADIVPGVYHANFKIAQTTGNDNLLFTLPDNTEIQKINLTLTHLAHSAALNNNGDWTVCTFPTPGQNNSAEDLYTAYAPTPVIDLAAGYYNGQQTVSVADIAGHTIRYTLNGTLPISSSPTYSGPITISETTVVKARAFSSDPNILPGKVDFKTYFIDESFTLPVFSIAADQLQQLANGAGEIRPIGSIEYFDKDQQLTGWSYGELNRHGQDSWALQHRSIDWVSRDEMGYNKAVDTKLFTYSDRTEYQRFMMRASGDDNYPARNASDGQTDGNHQGSCHIRDEYVHQLSQDGNMKLDVRAGERVVVFLNGDYWGVYGLRERPVDHDYTKEYYDQGKFDLEYVLTWGQTWTEYGGQTAVDNWKELRDFILEEDMSVETNYDSVRSQMQVLGLIDYMIVNLNVVSSDWMNYNTGWWRGTDPDGDHKKWGYILWDNDATFDYYINYSGVPNISPNAEPCDIDEISDAMDGFFGTEDPQPPANPGNCNSITNGSCPYPATDPIFLQVVTNQQWCCSGQWGNWCQDAYDEIAAGEFRVSGPVGRHEKIFLKMQEESETFRQLYYSRQADMMNTVFSCENMMYTLDSMLAIIEPEMPKQIARWGGSMTEWESNVQRMKDFIEARCELLDDGMVNCFDVTGPYDVTLNVEPAGAGEIEWNTLDIDNFPWTGAYFGGMENLAKAKVLDPLYKFDHWEYNGVNNTVLPNALSRSAAFMIEESDNLTAVFSLLTSTDEIDDFVEMTMAPNPAINEVTVKLNLEKAMDIDLSLRNNLGQEVKSYSKYSGKLQKGSTQMTLDLFGLPTGIYSLQLKADGLLKTKQLAVIHP